MAWCRDNGANVVSMSLGGCGYSDTANNLYNDLYNKNILIIAAAGNGGSGDGSDDAYGYPASYDNVVSVGMVDSDMILDPGSQVNDQVEFVGPGVAIRSTVPRGTGFDTRVVDKNSKAYESTAMEGSTSTVASGVTGELVDCGLGDSSCTAAAGGKVCLISRGDITFADKAANCESGGGAAAIIYNNATWSGTSGIYSGTLGRNPKIDIPVVGVAEVDGVTLNTQVGSQATVTVTAGDYDYYDGTSMVRFVTFVRPNWQRNSDFVIFSHFYLYRPAHM